MAKQKTQKKSKQDQGASDAQNPGEPPRWTYPLPTFTIAPPRQYIDYATLVGLFGALALIAVAIAIGQSNASFFNGPALLIVFFGTIAATAISFTSEELGNAWRVIGMSIKRKMMTPKDLAISLMHLSVISRVKGTLSLSQHYSLMNQLPEMRKAIELVVDGIPPENIERILTNEIESLKERHERSANITRRAAEIAPAMGLIGTLIGLVQMLADLQTPEAIGPAMAVALLTTFYGAVLGTIIMGPLAIKLEKYSADEVLNKTLIKIAATNIANHENPRRLEMLLNAELTPAQQVDYFN